MNKSRKIDLLYSKAKGRGYNASAAEMQELRKYRVQENEGSFYTTKSNISQYVTAVDNGCRTSFYDWCMNNNKADKRRYGSDERSMKSYDRFSVAGSIVLGAMAWSAPIYQLMGSSFDAKFGLIAGGFISFVLYKVARRWTIFTSLILPIILCGIIVTMK